MSATATYLSATLCKHNAANDENPSIRLTTISHPTTWRRGGSRDSEERETRRSPSGSRREVVAGERTNEQRMKMRATREENLTSTCDECRGVRHVGKTEREKMYLEMKLPTNTFETFLVEALYPGGVNIPDCIIPLEQKTPKHPKYKMPVNYFITLAATLINAEKKNQIPSGILSLLDTIIISRSRYSHIIDHYASDSENDRSSHECHQHFIDVMEDVKTILSRQSMPLTNATTATPAAKAATATIKRHNSTLGKRKSSLTSLDGSEQRKAVKTASTTESTSTSAIQQRPMYKLRSAIQPDTLTTGLKSGGIDKECAAAAKPTMSWAAIASAGIPV